MTEDQARQVLLVQAHEPAQPMADGALARLWADEDRAWATRQAVAAVGEKAAPEAFVLARAAAALQRLLPRAPAAQRWLARRAWHPAWVWLALVLGLLAGVAADQLGQPQRVNLLAPAVWAVVGWNLLVYLGLLLPGPPQGLRGWVARWLQRADEGVGLLWARHAAPLTGQRLALVLHVAAAALALGLVAGLYVRGLVLDYRIGWQSTFVDAPLVQGVLGVLLAPASALTGIVVPDVVPLRVGPGADAMASAAPWIHLLAATLLLWVVLPRLLLAALASWRAGRLARHFPLALDTPYFEGLHPLMRPGLAPQLRLLWVAADDAPAPRLFDQAIGTLAAPLTLVRSDEGDELQLHPQYPRTPEAGSALQTAGKASWWQRWLGAGGSAQPAPSLRERTDAVLWLTRPGHMQPAWIEDLGRPVVVLVDTPEAEPPRLSLHARADGWLAEGRLLKALEAVLPGDPRLPRLRKAWTALQQQRLDAGVMVVADSLAQIASSHQPVADEGLLARRAEAEAARAALARQLDVQWQAFESRLLALQPTAGAVQPGTALVPAEAAASAASAKAAAMRGKMGEGRAAMVGGVVTGALAGLKADVLSGGLTMGAGMVAGGLLGALGAAGVAKGLNVVRGTDHSFATWDEAALAPIGQGLLQRYLELAHGLPAEQARLQLEPAWAAQQGALGELWRGRQRRSSNPGEAEQLAQRLQPLLGSAVRRALGGP